MVPEVAGETEGSLLLEVVPLPFRRLLNCTIFAHTCEEHPLIETFDIGKVINELDSLLLNEFVYTV